MFKKSSKFTPVENPTSDAKTCKTLSTLSSNIPTAKEANKLFNDSLEVTRKNFKVISSDEIASEINKAIERKRAFIILYDVNIADEDVKALKEKGYSVKPYYFSSSASKEICISWSNIDLEA